MCSVIYQDFTLLNLNLLFYLPKSYTFRIRMNHLKSVALCLHPDVNKG